MTAARLRGAVALITLLFYEPFKSARRGFSRVRAVRLAGLRRMTFAGPIIKILRLNYEM